MERILLCSANPILVKNLHGALRDEGWTTEIADQTARAVQMVFEKAYELVIIDSECIGLSVADAARIIRSVTEEIALIVIGEEAELAGAVTVGKPPDLEEIVQVSRAMLERYPAERRI